jgi:CRISPR-associated protein Cmr3
MLMALTDVMAPVGFDSARLDGLGLGNFFNLRSAVLGKARREGGWNVVEHKSRPVRSLIPAGSVWYCDVIDPESMKQALKKSQGCLRIGEETAIGRGMLAVCLWKKN